MTCGVSACIPRGRILHKIMKEENIPLFCAGITGAGRRIWIFLELHIQYEMCYTNILQILDLCQIPLHASRP